MQFVAVVLWSINERLAGRNGADPPPLGLEWVNDVIEIAIRESEILEQFQEEQERARRRQMEGE